VHREREVEELDMMLQKILCFLTTSKDDMALSVLVHVLSVLEGIKMATFGAQKI
jgi:chromosome condensin MukBEF MukE localization factor